MAESNVKLSREQIEARVIAATRKLGDYPIDLDRDTNLAEVYHMDSLEVTSLVIHLEDAFEVELPRGIPDGDIERLAKTGPDPEYSIGQRVQSLRVRDIADYVLSKI